MPDQAESVNLDGDVPSSSLTPATRYPAAQTTEPVPLIEGSDERERGWNDSAGGFTDEWYLAERPPHHG